MMNKQNQNEYHREYEENQGRTHVEEEGYKKTEKTKDGGTKTTTYESKTKVTRYGDNGEIIEEGANQSGVNRNYTTTTYTTQQPQTYTSGRKIVTTTTESRVQGQGGLRTSGY